jgi:hypothetical protein
MIEIKMGEMVILLFVIVIMVVICVFTYYGFENFSSMDQQYASVPRMMSPKLQMTGNGMPLTSQPDIDYQSYLNSMSGYDSATRGYDNPYFTQNVMDGLDTN